jgi:hypothetical protein
MKKSMVFVMCMAFVICVNAQEREVKDYKLIAPAVTAETQIGTFTSLEEPIVFDASMKVRYFINECLALRLRLAMTTNTNKSAVNRIDASGRAYEDFTKFNSFGSGIILGAEYHFKGTKRVSPYLGLEAGFIFGADKSHLWSTLNNDYAKTKTPWMGCKTALVTGVDIYLLENFYCGIELGIAYDYRKFRDTQTETQIGTSKTKNEAKDFVSISRFNLGFAPALRLGWKF